MTVVDTSVLSLAFRRRAAGASEPGPVRVLRDQMRTGHPVVLPGIVVQEILSGVTHAAQFRRLRSLVAPFPILLANRAHHVAAAGVSNACRAAGVAASVADCLIAALTVAVGGELLTTDADFRLIARHCGLRLSATP